MSLRRPATMRMAEYASVKPTSVHCSSAREALNSAWIRGSASTTAEVGIDVTPLEIAMAASAPHRFSCRRPPSRRGRRNRYVCLRASTARPYELRRGESKSRLHAGRLLVGTVAAQAQPDQRVDERGDDRRPDEGGSGRRAHVVVCPRDRGDGDYEGQLSRAEEGQGRPVAQAR